jgi:hypothetical protein
MWASGSPAWAPALESLDAWATRWADALQETGDSYRGEGDDC